MKKIWFAIVLFVVGILCLRENAMAALTATVGFEANALMEDASTWDVTCTINGQSKITNGKLRIKYDETKLKLLSSDKGSLLDGMIVNLNDPINGNREEGEVLLVFASLSSANAKGELLKLQFAPISGQIKNGDKLSLSVETEELAYDNEAIPVTDSVMEITVGDPSGVSQTPDITDTKDEQTGDSGNISGTGASDPEQSSSETSTETEIQNSGNNASSGDNGNSGNNTNSGNNDSDSGSSDSSGNKSSSDTAAQSSSGTTVTSAKTGDETNIMRPIILAILALFVLAGGFVWSKKKK